MRIRVRGPSGQSTISLEDTATVQELSQHIADVTSLSHYDVRYGYPPKPLELEKLDPNSQLIHIGVKLHGEQLIVNNRDDSTNHAQTPTSTSTPLPPATKAKAKPTPRQSPLSLTRKQTDVGNDPPEIPSPEHGGMVVLRIMPDDNSCLFRAVGSAVLGAMDAMTELRSVVAQTIQEQPEIYNSAVLENRPDDYCRWIQTEEAWGGGIELGILSKHFEIEICSIDVQSLRVDRFNEGQPTRCILVYSGIHYDTIALTPANAPPEFDTKIFDSSDPIILERAVELCQILNQKHYFTDTAGFNVRCNVCGGVFVGEKGATLHASETGHHDFGEAA
ncbi:ubiquitin-specific protease otu1 [Myotisia sp. PD_48]|nr:ubiquitin-specific protease otu1 [Myotisia sp. PD_48]